MLTIALVGADGAGKTTVGRRLERELTVPVRYLYMGVNVEAGTHLLPTTRMVRRIKRAAGVVPDVGGPPDPLAARLPPREVTPARRLKRSVRNGARLGNRMAEEWYQQAIVTWHKSRGRVVIFDRHYVADFFAHDMAGGADLPLGRRIHGAVLDKAYPRPDLVVLLDAPPEVLLARNGEGTLESLARRRQEYLSYGGFTADFQIVDAARPLDDVVADVAELITDRRRAITDVTTGAPS